MIKVMIIEDDPMVRDINSKFTEKVEGFSMCGATGDISEAKDMLIKHKPQLLLLDIFLPKENGLEFLKWLRREEIRCDVMLITADSSVEAVQEAFRYGAIDYLVKPFTFQRFEEALIQYKKRYESIHSYKKLPQNLIDTYIVQVDSGDKNTEIVDKGIIKGLNPHTYNQIWEHIESYKDRAFTSEELAEEIGMARVTVRRYVEYMYKENKLEVELEYGKVGRPSHIYKVKSSDLKEQKE